MDKDSEIFFLGALVGMILGVITTSIFWSWTDNYDVKEFQANAVKLGYASYSVNTNNLKVEWNWKTNGVK